MEDVTDHSPKDTQQLDKIIININNNNNNEIQEQEQEVEVKEMEDRMVDCEICLVPFQENECSLLKEVCQDHIVCNECLGSYAHHGLIPIKAVTKPITCPGKNCQHIIHDSTLLKILKGNEKLLERYQNQLTESALSRMKDVIICPRVNCNSYVLYKERTKGRPSKDALCGVCHLEFCIRCKKHPHYGPCVGDTTTNLPKETETWISSHTRACPTCFIAIEKNGGCPNMYCIRCQKPFTWDRSLPGKFVPLDIKSNVMKYPTRSSLKLSSISQKCPNCKFIVQRGISSNASNHMKCGNCFTKFCFFCGVTVKSTFHFNQKGGCPQHGNQKKALCPLPTFLTNSKKDLFEEQIEQSEQEQEQEQDIDIYNYQNELDCYSENDTKQEEEEEDFEDSVYFDKLPIF